MSPETETEAAVVAVLGAPGEAAATELHDRLADRVRAEVRELPGFRSVRLHRGDDGTSVALRSLWDPATSGPSVVAALVRETAERSAEGEPAVFHGYPVPGLTGPESGSPPGFLVVALRRLRNAADMPVLLGLLHDSGTWKSTFPGFVEAIPYRGHDGVSFVNYPSWVDRAAFETWMADPRTAGSQVDVAELEAVPPRFVRCVTTEQIDPLGRRTTQARRRTPTS